MKYFAVTYAENHKRPVLWLVTEDLIKGTCYEKLATFTDDDKVDKFVLLLKSYGFKHIKES